MSSAVTTLPERLRGCLSSCPGGRGPWPGEDTRGHEAEAGTARQSGTGYQPGQRRILSVYISCSIPDVDLVVGDGLPLGLEVVIAAVLVNVQRSVEGFESQVLVLFLSGHTGVDGVKVCCVFGIHGWTHQTHSGEVELAEAGAGHVTGIAHL